MQRKSRTLLLEGHLFLPPIPTSTHHHSNTRLAVTADIMADDPHIVNDISEPVVVEAAKEDAETTAARRELKQTTISGKAGQDQDHRATTSDDDEYVGKKTPAASGDKDKPATTTAVTSPPPRTMTPDTDSSDTKEDAKMRERVSSPKKKRAHDELVADGSSTAGEGSGKPASTAVAQSRTEESEPEKKRPRDRESTTRRRSRDGAVRRALPPVHTLTLSSSVFLAKVPLF